MSRSGRARRRALGVAFGLLLDRALGEPPSPVHPVVWLGVLLGRSEQVLWADRRRAGVAYAALGLAAGTGAGRALRWVPLAVAVAAAGRSLRETALVVEVRLLEEDLDGARRELRALAGRDAGSLDPSGVSAAVVESLAENGVDAVVAPAFWALVGGSAGAAAYRAVNTMDAMVGHRSQRYLRFGWAAAKLDDLANYVPARLFALLVAMTRPRSATKVLRTVRRDAGAHPSPNSGVAEAAAAAALGRRLGGPVRYCGVLEVRPWLGDGPRPAVEDIARARRLLDLVERWLVSILIIGAVAPLRRPETENVR